jgi:hypothetical protein
MNKANWRASALSVVCVASALALQACGGGGGGSDTPAATAKGDVTVPNAVEVPTTQGSTAASLSVASGGTVALPQSSAQVSLPAASLVTASGNAATGTVKVTLTAIDPALNPQSMPSTSYLAAALGADGQPLLLESLGAIEVTLADASGQPLLLGAGQPATIRIPVRTRASGNPPATASLHYWDTTVQKWVQGGTATLKGDAINGFYYEGQVSHFTTWTADLPVEQTVTISGCVQYADGTAPGLNAVSVATDGIDYSGLVTVGTNATGQFSVRMKAGGHATLVATDPVNFGQVTVDLNQVTANQTLGSCLKLPAKPADPEALFNLLRPLYNVFSFALAPATVVDASTGAARLLPATDMCTTGLVDQVLLDKQTAAPQALVSAGTAHQLGVSFQACQVKQSAVGGDQSAYGTSVFMGDVSAQFTYSSSATGSSLQATTDVSGLLDLQSHLGSSGRYEVLVSTSADGLSTQTTVTPAAGTTLAKLLSGRKLSFQSGSVNKTGSVLRFDKLVFTLAGATYVVDGKVDSSTGGDVVISRDGVSMGGIASNQVYTAKGQRVDAF